MGRIISCCAWITFNYFIHLFIVVTFSQEYGHHTGIPVSIYIFVGCFIICDMYSIGSLLVIVLWKHYLRQGVACSYEKNTNLVTHFIGGIYLSCLYLWMLVFFAAHCW